VRLLADENIPGLESLEGRGFALRRLPGRAIGPDDLRDVQALLLRSVTRVDESLLARADALRFVGTATSGFDHVDRGLLERRGIAFAHAPGANANSVVEYVLAVIAGCDDMLERLLRRDAESDRVGIVGFGYIGRALASRLAAMDIAVAVYDPWLEPETLPNPLALDALLRSAVVCLHPALTDAPPFPSRHLLDAGQLAAVSTGSLLINASRGPVIDNRALLERLRRPDAPTVALDVWETEPRVERALLDRVRFGSAHIAGYSWDGKLRGTQWLLDALAQTLELAPMVAGGEESPFCVFPPDASRSSPADCLRHLLAQVYEPEVDDALLRDLVCSAPSEEALARGFDQLRKGYRQRRELMGARRGTGNWSSTARWAAQALGVIPGS
jgi:erythronate-4-phosphate dehydrogenase